MGSLAGPKARREPAGEAKPDVCVISDGEAGTYCTVGLVTLEGWFLRMLKNHLFLFTLEFINKEGLLKKYEFGEFCCHDLVSLN